MRIILAYDPNSAWSVAEKLPQSRIPIVMDLDNSMVALSRGKYRAAPKRARFEPTHQGHCEARPGGSRATLLRQVEIGGALNPLPRESIALDPRLFRSRAAAGKDAPPAEGFVHRAGCMVAVVG